MGDGPQWDLGMDELTENMILLVETQPALF